MQIHCACPRAVCVLVQHDYLLSLFSALSLAVHPCWLHCPGSLVSWFPPGFGQEEVLVLDWKTWRREEPDFRLFSLLWAAFPAEATAPLGLQWLLGRKWLWLQLPPGHPDPQTRPSSSSSVASGHWQLLGGFPCPWLATQLSITHVTGVCAQSCPTLSNPTDCSPPGSSVHGILQARILEWAAMPFSRGSSWPRDLTHISCFGRRILYHWATW